MFKIPGHLLKGLLDLAEKTAPDEACALLVGRREIGDAARVSRIEISPNKARDRRRRFDLDDGLRIGLERELRNAEDRIVAIWHSVAGDGGAEPSQQDAGAAYEPDLFWLITAVIDRQAVQTTVWRPRPGGQAVGHLRPVPLFILPQGPI